jgi:hypothetical protein
VLFRKRDRRKLAKIRVGQLLVLGEQDGPFEPILKEKLVAFFHHDRSVIKAYLSRADVVPVVGRALCWACERTLGQTND